MIYFDLKNSICYQFENQTFGGCVNGTSGATVKPAKILIDHSRLREKAKKVTDSVVDKTTETGAKLLKEGVNFVTQPTTIRVTGKVVGMQIAQNIPPVTIPAVVCAIHLSEESAIKTSDDGCKKSTNEHIGDSAKSTAEVGKERLHKSIDKTFDWWNASVSKC